MKALPITTTFAAALALCAAFPGCGGGSSSTPTITARPKRTPTGGAVPATNGKKPAGGNNVPSGGVGSFKGTVLYDGAPPTPGKPDGFNTKDKYCTSIQAKITDHSLLVDSATKGLKNVVIYLARKPAGYRVTVPKDAVKFINRNCQFVPRMLPVVVGQTVDVTSEDNTSHNTHTQPLNPASTPFNESLLKGQTKTFVYGGLEKLPVRVKCDIHGWMAAYHLPLDHDFFAVTNDKGEFEIKGLPAGTHKFNIWHERVRGYLEHEISITIKGGATEQRTFKYAPSKFASLNGPPLKTIVLSLSK
jgi:plastocyanin